MSRFVSYYRVSTDRQGRSGLGLEGQEAAVIAHASSCGTVIASYTEIETGKRDTLDNRPELRKAIAHAKRSKAVLLVAKLDRLTRSVAVMSMLHASGIEFVCCDNPFANRLTIQILAAVAEDEARRISERTKAALEAYKRRGGLLGAALPQCRNLTPEARKRGNIAACRSIVAQFACAYVDVLEQVREMRDAGMSFRQIAAEMNRLGHTTRRGLPWNPMQVSRVLSLAAAA